MMKRAILMILLLGALGLSGCGGYRDFSTPVNTMKTFLLATHKGNYATAYACLSEEYQKQMPFDSFKVGYFKKYETCIQPNRTNLGIHFPEYRDENHVIVPFDLGTSVKRQLLVRNRRGQWKIPPADYRLPPPKTN